jgi:hypothetical protein
MKYLEIYVQNTLVHCKHVSVIYVLTLETIGLLLHCSETNSKSGVF